ncbi:hypothetical protein TorRG33x02_144880 [Trema orientale]|uniref:Uncharacterized protein n=1 Tax=Trema orientale TaxID=63057 RepID=A0A2P5EVT9_TREOI|nr:hypothetical protein TorRG33x02_144880 [Trema orientale]
MSSFNVGPKETDRPEVSGDIAAYAFPSQPFAPLEFNQAEIDTDLFAHVSEIQAYVENKIVFLENNLYNAGMSLRASFQEIAQQRELYWALRNRMILIPVITPLFGHGSLNASFVPKRCNVR